MADICIMPFVRQFAHVDQDVFYSLPCPHLQQWLREWLAHPLFQQVMVKFPPWRVMSSWCSRSIMSVARVVH